jgi:hypothetical protein
MPQTTAAGASWSALSQAIARVTQPMLNLMVLDQARVCGCSHSPVSRLPRGLSFAATQARTSSTKALLLRSATGSGAVCSALKEPLEGR